MDACIQEDEGGHSSAHASENAQRRPADAYSLCKAKSESSEGMLHEEKNTVMHTALLYAFAKRSYGRLRNENRKIFHLFL